MYALHQHQGTTGGLSLVLFLYIGVATCLGFGLYELLQPARIANPGLSIYKPPPRAVVSYTSDAHRSQHPGVSDQASTDSLGRIETTIISDTAQTNGRANGDQIIKQAAIP